MNWLWYNKRKKEKGVLQMFCIYTLTAKEAIEEMTNDLRYAQSSICPHKEEVTRLKSTIEEFSYLADNTLIHKFEDGSYQNLMD